MEKEPLYCYKVNWKTYKIERYEITDYTIRSLWSSNNPVFGFYIGNYKQHIHVDKLDTVTRDKYVSTTDDYDKAKTMILDAYKIRLNKAQKNYINAKKVVEKLTRECEI